METVENILLGMKIPSPITDLAQLTSMIITLN